MTHTVCLVPGDGIGPEVTSAARRVIEATGVNIEWVNLPAGETGIEFFGSVLPERTIAAILGHGVALKGPITTPIAHGHGNVSIKLRQRLGLSAAVRPVKSMPGVRALLAKVDLVIIRENTEGLFCGIEDEIIPGVVQALPSNLQNLLISERWPENPSALRSSWWRSQPRASTRPSGSLMSGLGRSGDRLPA